MEQRKGSKERSIDSAAWTGDIDVQPKRKRRKTGPMPKWQIVLSAIILPLIIAFSWFQVYEFFSTGALHVRYSGPTTFDERPARFAFAFLLAFGVAGLSGLVILKAITSPKLRKRLIEDLTKAWRKAPWLGKPQ